MEPLGLGDPAEIGGYRLRGRLGVGGMGAVYLAHTRAGQPVALKVIRDEYAQNPEFRRRFAREVHAARRVQGLYTAPVVDSDTEGPQPWLASAYVPGPSLSAAVAERGPLTVRTVLQLAAGVAEALSAIHAVGVIHRDLKPSNVLLAADGPRVIDFGIARAADATSLTSSDVRLGTPGYMAPEQIAGGVEPGPAIDVFALGLLVHFASTGRHPFGESSGPVLLYRIVAEEPDLRDCPPELRELVDRCLTKEPSQRPFPGEVIDLCRTAAGDGLLDRDGRGWLPEPVADHPLPPSPVPPQPTAAPTHSPEPPPSASTVGLAAPARPLRPRRPARVAGAAAIALTVVAGAAFAVTQWGDGAGDSGKNSGAPSARPLGDIIVDGKPVTGYAKTPDNNRFATKRTYPNGPMWAPVTGYTSRAFGTSGLEAIHADILGKRETKGGQVVTTLDSGAQKAAFEGLGDRKGAVVALDPKTGAILALASTPSYDPASFAGNSSKDSDAWKSLTEDKDKPMLNRALRETYPPGSTFKVVTAAAALESGNYDIDEPTGAGNEYQLPLSTVTLSNANTGACGDATLQEALQWSCNTDFAKVSDELGNEEMIEQAGKFGFGEEVLTPVRATASSYPKDERPLNALAGIGQASNRATPLQMAMVASAVSNDGKLMKPYMVDELRDPDLKVIERTSPATMNKAVSTENARKLQQMMETVVAKGTGRSAEIPGVTVGGKTGTAQSGVGNTTLPYAWFISYAKDDKGESVAVAVVVEDPDADREDISGGGDAASIAKDVMNASLSRK